MPTSPAAGPLAGVRVIELGTTVMAPFAAQRLGDLGADVVKIEGFEGDPNRAMAGGDHPELSGVALGLHRNKRSIALDLKHPDGLAVARELVAGADVFVTNMRAPALARLGLDAETVRADHPALVYVEAHGFSLESGRADEPAYDDTIQALVGLPALSDAAGGGMRFAPTLIGDKVAGLAIVEGVLAALVHRGRTGEGQRVEVPMFDATLSFMMVEHLALAAFPGGQSGYSRILTANRGPHRTRDGWLSVTPYIDRHWRALFTEAGRADLLEGEAHASPAARLREADVVYAQLKEILLQRTSAEWLAVCRRLDVPVAEVAELADLIDDESRHHGAIRTRRHPLVGPYRAVDPPIRFSGSPTAAEPRPAPLIGADAREVLAELGRGAPAIAELIAVGAVKDPDGA